MKAVDGRIIAMVVMLLGIGFLSVLTATVASYFVKSDRAAVSFVAAQDTDGDVRDRGCSGEARGAVVLVPASRLGIPRG